MSIELNWRALKANRRNQRWIMVNVTVVMLLAGLLGIYFWLGYNPVAHFVAEVPGRDGAPEGAKQAPEVDLAGVFTQYDGRPADLPGKWPAFRGPDGRNIAVDAPPLAASWGQKGPTTLWTINVGDGYAAPAIQNGRVYLIDYDVERRADSIRCISLEDGKDIWRRSYDVNIKRNHGMSRTIPAVDGQYVVTLGPKCHVVCLDAATGDFRWGIDLQRDYGTEVPLWYAAQCPRIVDGTAIIAPAGSDTLMMAVDCATGEVLWKTPNPHGWKMSHSSVIPMTLLGKEMYVYAALGGISGVSAATGELLWEIPWDAKVVAPSPVQAEDDLVFMTAGYGKGSRLLRLREEAGAFTVEIVYDRAPGEVLSCEQQTPIYHDGLLYGIMPKDAGALKGQFVCFRPDGTAVWSSGQDNRFGLGPFLLADGKFYILDDEGTLTVAVASQEEYRQLGHDAWGPLALAGTRLLLRDMNTLACVELATDGDPSG